MTGMTDRWVISGLMLLADWSVRWGLILVALAAWFALRPPRRAATRHRLCAAALAASLLLPLAPKWANATVSWPSPAPAPVTRNVPPQVAHEAPVEDVDDRRSGEMTRPVVVAYPARDAASRPDVPPRSSRLGPWRIAALVVAGAWASVALALLVRLAAGRLVLARFRRGARPVGSESERLLDDCRRALGLKRPAALAAHPAVRSPLTLGGRRPLVLVPPDWCGWPEPDRRACLLHELAHLVRHDDRAKLVQELVRAPFAFHPLVLWLLARLDRERELLCDEAVVALGADPVSYARLLLDLARRPGRLLPDTPASRPGWLPFLDRRTVAVRIERLLEDDMPRTLSRPSPVRSVFVGALALAAALGVGGLRVQAVSAQPPGDETKPTAPASSPGPERPTNPTPPAAKPPQPADMKVAPREWGGTVLDADGRPVADATIVAGASGTSRPAHQVLKTDAEGRFTWPLPTATDMLFLVAYKDGLTAAAISAHPSGLVEPHAIRLRLAAPVPFSATLVDTDGRPVAGAKVRVEMMAHGSASKNGETTNVSVGYTRVSREVLSGTPAEDLFTTTTAADGSFTFRAIRPDTGLKLAVAAPDGREFRIKADPGIVGLVARTMQDQGFVTAPPGRATRLLAVPAARVGGRVVTKLPGVGVSGLRASYQDSHQPGVYQPRSNFGADARTDADGRFAFDGLNEGTVNVFVHGDGENKDWTYRAAKDVVLTPGATSEVTLELVRGVDVEGTVVTQSTGAPVEGAQLGVYGPHRPRTGAMTTGARTDARGRYHYRLPSGETYFYVMGPPGGYSKLAGEGSSRTVKIPDGASRYEVPPIELATAVTVSGRVVDAAGTPVAGARVVGVCQGSRCVPLEGMQAVTDSAGGFRLPAGWYNTVPVGQVAHLLIRLRDGDEHEAAALPTADGAVTVKLNAVVQRPKPDARPRGAAAVEGPREVAPGELAGVVVDRDGNPIEGVEADVNHWAPGQVTHTDRGGKFQFTGLSKDESRHPVRFRKEGYETQYHLDRKAGRPGWVVVLGNTTYFEGRVLAPDGSPVPDAVVRADSGPRRGIGFMMGECYTETTSRPDGRYRLHVEPGAYDVEVRVPGVGVARSKDVIDADQTVKRDIRLEPGVTFVILTIEHGTGRPVGGVRLEHWMKPGIEGTSGPDGRIVIRDVPPGTYSRFEVKADGYTRWWSDACLSEWKRSHRNSDWLDFEVKPGMSPVTVEMERGATVTGRVLDPDGKPVAGATVALPLTGTGFSVETDNDGRFSALLPASGDREYNLVTHDGKYNQWRSWANGVSPAFRTKPGEQVTGLDLRLTRPASVRGRVTDTEGRPVANRQVRASAADRMENGYYDPTTRTDADGTYELKFIRPGQQYVQIAPFWGDARQAPEGTSRTLTLSEGEVKDGVEFQVTGRNGVD